MQFVKIKSLQEKEQEMVEVGIDWMIDKLRKKISNNNSKLIFYENKKNILKSEISRINRITWKIEREKIDTEKWINKYEKTKEDSPDTVLMIDDNYYFEEKRKIRTVLEKFEIERKKIANMTIYVGVEDNYLEEIEKNLKRLDEITIELGHLLEQI